MDTSVPMIVTDYMSISMEMNDQGFPNTDLIAVTYGPLNAVCLAVKGKPLPPLIDT